MEAVVEAIYESGHLRLLTPLQLPEHARVTVRIASDDTPERAAWLAQGERRLRSVWDNEADEVFNDLLTQ